MEIENDKTMQAQVMLAIVNKETFDLYENPIGYPTISYLIAHEILSGRTEYDRYLNIEDYAKSVAQTLDLAINRLKDEYGIDVYRVKCLTEDGKIGRKIQIISTDPKYKEDDFTRRANICKMAVKSLRKSLIGTHHEQLTFLHPSVVRLEHKLEEEDENGNNPLSQSS